MKRSVYLTLYLSTCLSEKENHIHLWQTLFPPRALQENTCQLDLYQPFLDQAGTELFVLSSLCENAVQYLTTRLAGEHGPVLQEDMEVVMCSEACIANDMLHLEAMAVTGCTCTELASNSHIELDFCRQNSGTFFKRLSKVLCFYILQKILARFLCTHLGACGIWECQLNEYMCPRNEWDRRYPCTGMALQPKMWLSMILVVNLLLK